jgi:DNA-binding NtrC family response regulator/predicted negative regulator of RcsB-dependent stress response
MNLTAHLLGQIDSQALSHAQRARLRCQLARELEEAGKYEAARVAMGEFWGRVGERPDINNLDLYTQAEVLLRAGVLSGWIGSSKQLEGSQEAAKNLISESITLFEELREKEKSAEALTELAYCYWREGALDEARVMLSDALARFGDSLCEQKAVALIRVTVVENAAARFNDSLRALAQAAPIVDASSNHTLKGRFHVQLATALKNLGTSENRQDYIDRTLIEYAAASFHFEQAGHLNYCAAVENNLGGLYLNINRLIEAHEHLERARKLFAGLNDEVHRAQVDETRARVFLAEGRWREAEKAARSAIRTLEQGDEQALLAEALTTFGVALARLGEQKQAQSALQRASEVAHQAGDLDGAGLAELTMIEELAEHLTCDELRAIYERADKLLANSQHSKTLSRLRSCARTVLSAEYSHAEEFGAPSFIYASERIAALLRDAHRIAGTMGAVLIAGETGTGKELLARLIHQWSGRAGEFVPINCSALTDTLIESQLFGHVRGSFMDAVVDHPGAVRQAAGGTLLLDEIGELSLGNQVKLLRLIERGEVHTIGAPEPERVDVRIIAATNSNLSEQVKKGRFRSDLLYRLQTFHLEIPPLRERPEDIARLAEHFIKEIVERHPRRVTFTPEAMDAIRRLPLKGNVRELRSLIERTVLTATEGSTIMADAIETTSLRQTQMVSFADPWANFQFDEEILRYEASLIKLAFDAARGSVTRAARLLGMPHQRLSAMLQQRHKNLPLTNKAARERRRSIIKKLT